MRIEQSTPFIYFLSAIVIMGLLYPIYCNAASAQMGTISYVYDGESSRLTGVISSTIGSFNITYDALGRRTSLTYPNGVVTTYTYDNTGNILEIVYKSPLGTFEKLTYSYDPTHNRLDMNSMNCTSKLPQSAANISYDSANRMLTFNGKEISYDENGNMTSITNNCGTTTYTWSARNQLVAINGFNVDCSSLNASLKYDALGRRIKKTVNGKTIQYLYDGMDIAQEIENGMVTVNYIRTLNIDEPLTRIKLDGTIRYYHQDALGSVIALTDENGTVKTRYCYGPFGEAEVIGEQSDNPFQFVGRENDGTGLLYERSRYYSFELQRFISEDPIKFAGGDVNFYTRVGNNPVNYTDPMGLAIWICNRKTKMGIGNHSYLWDDRNNTCCGMGSTKSCKGKGPKGGDSCRKVESSDGKEDKVIKCCKETADKGIWLPPVNDCHEAADDCLQGADLKNPGAPGGRVGKPCDPCSK